MSENHQCPLTKIPFSSIFTYILSTYSLTSSLKEAETEELEFVTDLTELGVGSECCMPAHRQPLKKGLAAKSQKEAGCSIPHSYLKSCPIFNVLWSTSSQTDEVSCGIYFTFLNS